MTHITFAWKRGRKEGKKPAWTGNLGRYYRESTTGSRRSMRSKFWPAPGTFHSFSILSRRWGGGGGVTKFRHPRYPTAGLRKGSAWKRQTKQVNKTTVLAKPATAPDHMWSNVDRVQSTVTCLIGSVTLEAPFKRVGLQSSDLIHATSPIQHLVLGLLHPLSSVCLASWTPYFVC